MPITRRQFWMGSGAIALTAGGVITVPMLRRPGHMEPATSRAAVVETDTVLPPEADVVIIGAGIMGVATAFFLAERGLKVVVCEKGSVACEQSSRAYGQVTNWGQQAVVTGLGQHSKSLWAGMNAKIGADTSYRNYGRVQAFQTDEEIEKARAWLAEAQRHEPAHAPLQARFIEGSELQALMPGAQSPWKMGLYQEDDGGMEPAYAAPAVARGAQALGVTIVGQCAVRSLETAAGAISGVITEKGPIKTTRVLCSAGSWSRLFLGNAGIDLPLLPVYLSQQRLQVTGGPPACGAAGRAVWRQEVDGSYSNGPRIMTSPITREHFALLFDFAPELPAMLFGETPLDMTIGPDLASSFQIERSWRPDEVSPFETRRIMAPVRNDGTLDESLSWLTEEFPVFAQARVIERWAGTVDVAHDQVPVASAVPAVPGLFVTGGFTYGLTQGLGAGDMMAALMLGETPKIDPAPYRLDRIT